VIVNLLGHDVLIRPEGGEPVLLPASGEVAYLAHSAVREDGRDQLPCVLARPWRVHGLPARRAGVWLLVSPAVVLAAGHRRWDLVCVDESRPVRDGAGRVAGYRRLLAFDAGGPAAGLHPFRPEHNAPLR
jgi:hypothetical protein